MIALNITNFYIQRQKTPTQLSFDILLMILTIDVGIHEPVLPVEVSTPSKFNFAATLKITLARSISNSKGGDLMNRI